MDDQKPLITAVWLYTNESKKDGSKYLAGNAGNLRVMIFPIRNPKGKATHRLVLAEREEKPAEATSPTPHDDDIPF